MALCELNPVGIHGIKTTEYTKVNKQDWVSDEIPITEAICNMRLDMIKIPPCSNVFSVEN